MLFSETFLEQIHTDALAIAWQRRREHHLQSVGTLGTKFEAEKEELGDAEEVWDELPDVTYYAACLLLQIRAEIERFCTDYSVSVRQLEAATLAKYQRRVQHTKNIKDEREAIFAAIEKAKEKG